MELVFRNAHGTLNNDDRDYAVRRLSKLERCALNAERVELVHSQEKQTHKVHLTVFSAGQAIHGVVADSSLRAAIDMASRKVTHSLRKVKRKIVQVRNSRKLKV